jgi:DNA-binding transcriptional regulator PaaX
MSTPTLTALEGKIVQHLRGNPWLTAFEVGRAIGHAMGGVRNALVRMQAAGHVESRERPRHDGDPRPRVEWRVPC